MKILLMAQKDSKEKDDYYTSFSNAFDLNSKSKSFDKQSSSRLSDNSIASSFTKDERNQYIQHYIDNSSFSRWRSWSKKKNSLQMHERSGSLTSPTRSLSPLKMPNRKSRSVTTPMLIASARSSDNLHQFSTMRESALSRSYSPTRHKNYRTRLDLKDDYDQKGGFLLFSTRKKDSEGSSLIREFSKLKSASNADEYAKSTPTISITPDPDTELSSFVFGVNEGGEEKLSREEDQHGRSTPTISITPDPESRLSSSFSQEDSGFHTGYAALAEIVIPKTAHEELQ